MERDPKPKQMQQGSPNVFFFAWFSLPKWMENNPHIYNDKFGHNLCNKDALKQS
jgi:hypothetical protein